MKSLIELWSIPLFCVLNLLLGFLFMLPFRKFVTVTPQFERMFLMSASVPNINSIPYQLVMTLCGHKGALSHFDNALFKGQTYVALYTAIVNLLFWIFCYPFAVPDKLKAENKDKAKLHDGNSPNTQISVNGDRRDGHIIRHQATQTTDDEGTVEIGMYDLSEPSSNTVMTDPELQDEDDGSSPLIPNENAEIIPRKPTSKYAQMKAFIGKHYNRLPAPVQRALSPIVTTTLISVVVGMIEPIKRLFHNMDPNSTKKPILNIITRSTVSVGGGAVAALLLIMGASLYHNATFEFRKYWRIIFCVVLVRGILMPIVGFGLTYGLQYYKLIDDPILFFVLALEFAPPPNINWIVVCQMDKIGEKEMSMIFLYSYLSSIITLSVFITFLLSYLL